VYDVSEEIEALKAIAKELCETCCEGCEASSEDITRILLEI
jgi:hypothetical protein